jgi:hypothetical protein
MLYVLTRAFPTERFSDVQVDKTHLTKFVLPNDCCPFLEYREFSLVVVQYIHTILRSHSFSGQIHVESAELYLHNIGL